MSSVALSPVRVRAELEPDLSRWLWLVKWILAFPHYVVLAFLWIAFVAVSVIALFAILFAGRYPRALFDFNVGVLRWTWRVAYYAYCALGTDRYPPFSLEEDPDYPAHLEIAYPVHLSRGLVLVKWWLLAIPHYVVVALLIGGTTWFAERWAVPMGGLVGILVLVAAIVLLFTGRYPRSVFDLVLGFDRWVLRVAAYVGLMTDDYPPFRLDMGGDEPGGTLTIRRPDAAPAEPGPEAPPPPPPGSVPRRRGWTGGRITVLVIGCVLGLVSLGLMAGGGFLLWADQTQRDARGFITTEPQRLATGTYALTATATVVREGAPGWVVLHGPGITAGPTSDDTVLLRVGSTEPGQRVFVGVGRTAAVSEYLAGVARADVRNVRRPGYDVSRGTVVPIHPGALQRVWTASSSGTGTQAIRWNIASGSWTFVVMNADASRGVDVRVVAGARFPHLLAIGIGLLVAGFVLALIATTLVVISVVRASRAMRP